MCESQTFQEKFGDKPFNHYNSLKHIFVCGSLVYVHIVCTVSIGPRRRDACCRAEENRNAQERERKETAGSTETDHSC